MITTPDLLLMAWTFFTALVVAGTVFVLYITIQNYRRLRIWVRVAIALAYLAVTAFLFITLLIQVK